MIEVIPAILETDVSEIQRKMLMVDDKVSWVQIDIADGMLVPNTVLPDPHFFQTIDTSLQLELHMMVKDPLRFLSQYFQVGFKRFFAHIEGDFVQDFITKCQNLGVEKGLAIDGSTDADKIAPFIDHIDGVLVMAIEAGFSGRPYREDTQEKIKKIRQIDSDIPIAVDGAMNDVNALKVITAGATRINSNSYLFQSDDVWKRIEILRNLDRTFKNSKS